MFPQGLLGGVGAHPLDPDPDITHPYQKLECQYYADGLIVSNIHLRKPCQDLLLSSMGLLERPYLPDHASKRIIRSGQQCWRSDYRTSYRPDEH